VFADVVSSFVNSAKKGGVGFGFYYSVVSNQLCNVCNGKVQPSPATGQLPVTQAEYDALVLEHLTELWGNYGPLEEVWFDGGYSATLKANLTQLLAKLQPHVIAFGGQGLVPSPARWVGTEAGYAPYPCWSTDDDPSSNGAGKPDGSSFIPGDCTRNANPTIGQIGRFDYYFLPQPRRTLLCKTPTTGSSPPRPECTRRTSCVRCGRPQWATTRR
jgi:hypothetical protein